MTVVSFSSEIQVTLTAFCGCDEKIAHIARLGLPHDEIKPGWEALIGYLMKQRHGTPFEHNYLQFHVSAPIFVFRELHRHRIGFSYNELSGRYRQLPSKFYVPDPDRKIKPIEGYKASRPQFDPAAPGQYKIVLRALTQQYQAAYEAYEAMIDAGVAKEVARACLPVGIYSECYVSCNARSLMNLLSLRVHCPEAKYVSFPQYEIEVMAKQMEHHFAELFPVTYAAFIENGRVAP